MALFGSIPQIINVVFVMLLFFLIFAIVCVNFLKGGMSICTGMDSWSSDQKHLVFFPVAFNASMVAAGWGELPGYAEVTSKAVCLWMNGTWDYAIGQNFDNVANALNTMLQVATTSQWADVTYQSVDSRGEGLH